MREDETTAFWLNFYRTELAERCAVLHRQRRELSESLLPERIRGARSVVAELFLKGRGLEVGPGDRPFPVPGGVNVRYGDIRPDPSKTPSPPIDAQTFQGIDEDSEDFVISAHVIQMLWDPVGSIVQAMRIIRPGGVFILVVPDKRHTFDVDRPETTVDHVAADFADGGEGTRRQAYREHFTHVHPRSQLSFLPSEIERAVDAGIAQKNEIHVHAWTRDGFAALLKYAATVSPFQVEAAVSIVNENIFVLRKPA